MTDRLRADFRLLVRAVRAEPDVAVGCAKMLNAVATMIGAEVKRGIGSDDATKLMRELVAELQTNAQTLGVALAEHPKAKPGPVQAHDAHLPKQIPDLHPETIEQEHQRRKVGSTSQSAAIGQAWRQDTAPTPEQELERNRLGGPQPAAPVHPGTPAQEAPVAHRTHGKP